jgi:hypothetical protein
MYATSMQLLACSATPLSFPHPLAGAQYELASRREAVLLKHKATLEEQLKEVRGRREGGGGGRKTWVRQRPGIPITKPDGYFGGPIHLIRVAYRRNTLP